MEQDFYENTTIVLCGDHTTMDSNFCNNVDDDYNRRVYTTFINSAVSPQSVSAYRTYTTLDCFPTTLAAMGVQIEGDRLGLGVNLFSLEPTLYEVYGEKLMTELNKKSEFMEQISEFDPTTEEYKAYLERHGVDTSSLESSAESGTESKKKKVEPAEPIVEREITN
jgi:phosphoglycerol transferase